MPEQSLSKDINEERAGKLRITNERQMLQDAQQTLIVAACFNVTQDEFIPLPGQEKHTEKLYTDEQLAEAEAIVPGVHNQKDETLNFLLGFAFNLPDPNDRSQYIKLFSHEGLMDMYRNGISERIIEYKRIRNGNSGWVRTRLVLLVDPDSNDLFAFFYTSDITEEKKREKVVSIALELDSDFVALINVKKLTVKFSFMSQTIKRIAPHWDVSGEQSYEEGMERTIHLLAAPVDRIRLKKETDVEFLMTQLEKGPVFRNVYDLHLPNGIVLRKQLIYRWLDEDKEEIYAQQYDITDAFEKEKARISELAASVRKADLANKAKTEFVSRISHDIRTPIGAIKNLTAFAKEDIDDRERLLDDINRIESSNEYLLSLINDVLDISKIDSGRIELHAEPYPYSEYLTNLRNVMEPMCEKKGITCCIEGEPPAHGTMLADKVRVNQIVLNLLSNAVTYTPVGGKITYISNDRPLSNGTMLHSFTIKDTGIGMSEAFQKDMFGEFTQEHNNPLRQKNVSGTGLGLSIVKRVVDLMNGSIKVDSHIGEGTSITVEIIFPDSDAEENIEKKRAAEAAETEDLDSRKLSGNVLLVEDNEINTMIALRILMSYGLTVEHAEDGEKAVSMFSSSTSGQYNAILMDVQMPKMDGYEATRAIRSMETQSDGHIPIIAMTANAFEDAIRAGIEAGMDDYLTKPLDPKLLKRTLMKYLN